MARLRRGPAGGVRAGRPGGGRGRLPGPAGPARRPPAGGLPQLRRGLPRGGLLRDRQPLECRRLGRGRPGPRTASSPTSAGPGPGSPASASPGRAGTTTATPAPGTAPPPTRCWWSATRFDPATPYHGAVTVDRLLPRSRLLTLAGWGHTSLFSLRLHRRPCEHLLPDHTGTGEGTVCEPGRGAVRRAGRDRAGPAGHRGVQQERPDPADAPADADRLSDRRRCPSQGVG